MDAVGRYSRAVDQFEQIRGLIPKFAAADVQMRPSEPISPAIQRELRFSAGIVASNRDRAVAALREAERM